MIIEKEISSEQLLKDFKKHSRKIAKYLDEKNIKKNPTISIQKTDSEIEIPKHGYSFGVKQEENKIIIANWIYKLQKKELPIIIEFLLIREAFRLFLYKKIPDRANYQDLIEILLNIITLNWIVTEEQLRLIDPKIIFIRSRTPFKDTKEFRHLNWEWVIIDSHKYRISSYKLFTKLIELVEKGIEQKLSQKNIADDYLNWVEGIKQKENFKALPITFKQKHFDMLIAMVELGALKASAKKVGEKIGKSYNVVDISFKELFDEYFLFWRSKPNINLLKLYPYFFRLTLTSKDYLTTIIRKLKPIQYIKEFDFHILENGGCVLTGTLDCPLVISNKLANYFEKIAKQGFVQDYFFQMMSEQKGLSTITTDELELTKKTFEQLTTNPEKFAIKTLEIFDYNYEITKAPKLKKAIFDKNVISYISLIAGRYLGKAHYMFSDVDKGYKFFAENNIDHADSKAYKSFMSQLDFRCRRLGVLDYFLNIQYVGNFNNSLYIEIIEDPESEKLNEYLTKISVFSSMIITTFNDRVTIHFPKITYDTPLREVLTESLDKYQFDYLIYPLNYYKEFIPDYNLQYDELYDFEEQRWKY